MTVLTVLLAVALLVATGGAAALALQVRRVHAELVAARAELARREQAHRAPMPIKAAGRVVRTVVETATRVRERGVGGMLLATVDDFTRWATESRSTIARVAGPDGTVTVFFSDIEGSTALNNELGDAGWMKLLAAHDAIVERYVDRFRGSVVKTQGDGHMVVFSTASLALSAALGMQHAFASVRTGPLRRTPVRVRIGLHTGPAIERNGDFFGQNVALAARIAAEAAGGEVLVSEVVVELADTEFTFEPGEVVELKGFEGARQLWRVQPS